ncbi:MAG: hypothetical protein O7F12_08620 [Nitrospirae bacterium]|nr:hypothetical protein [Nitrospirota bacterium]
MNWQEQIEQELGQAASGLREKNDGLARVCARRAVGLTVQAWIERSGVRTWPVDVMNQLRKIQQQEIFPLELREAAQRFLTKVTQRCQAPFSTDPIADTGLILKYLDQLT